MSKILPRPEVLSAPAAPHGAFDYEELERLNLNAGQIIDFSVNSNPYGPSPAVRAAIAEIPLDLYPDREALALRRALAARLGLELTQIVVGNGTAELLSMVAVAFLQPDDGVIVLGPTFSEYPRVSALMGARVTVLTAPAESGFAVNPAAVHEALSRIQPRVVFCCNPNNPTGSLLPLDTLKSWSDAHPTTLFVVDEAYLNFVAASQAVPSAATLRADNILVLRSMTKDYALASLRLGYAVGEPGVIEALARVRPAWNVNGLAQAAGLTALNDDAYLKRTLTCLEQAKREFVNGLTALGLAPLPSAVHYFLVEVGNAKAFRAALLADGVMVRDCASFGLPQYVRIATRTPDENARLLTAVARLHRQG